MAHAPTVSVIVTTYNRAAWLGELLDALRLCAAETPALAEVVVVDNGSADNTARVLAERQRLLPLHIVDEPRPGKRFALRSGIEVARGDLTLLIDDDALPARRDWAAVYAAGARTHPGAAFFGGPVRPLIQGRRHAPRWFATLAPGSRVGFDRPAGLVAEPCLLGSNWACRRDVARDAVRAVVDGQTPGRTRWTGDEVDFQRELLARGATGWFLPEAPVLHRVPRHELTLGWLLAWNVSSGRVEATRFLHHHRFPPRWRFAAIARDVAAIARDDGPFHRKRALLNLGRDVGFLVELGARLKRRARRREPSCREA
jgi:glycosyltransferase involved in cell wall biosynthesis